MTNHPNRGAGGKSPHDAVRALAGDDGDTAGEARHQGKELLAIDGHPRLPIQSPERTPGHLAT